MKGTGRGTIHKRTSIPLDNESIIICDHDVCVVVCLALFVFCVLVGVKKN